MLGFDINTRDREALEELANIYYECSLQEFTPRQAARFIQWFAATQVDRDRHLFPENLTSIRNNLPGWMLMFKKSKYYE